MKGRLGSLVASSREKSRSGSRLAVAMVDRTQAWHTGPVVPVPSIIGPEISSALVRPYRQGSRDFSTFYNFPRSRKTIDWADPERSLAFRVQALLSSLEIHPAEIQQVNSNLWNLMTECCKLRSYEGMEFATQTMLRALQEKRRTLKSEGDKLIVPVKAWERLLFGWVKLAKSSPVVAERMKGVVDMALIEAEKDEELLKEHGEGTQGDGKEKMPQGPHVRSSPISSQPDVSFFNTYLQGLAEAVNLNPQIVLVAEKTIQDMKKYNTEKGWHTKPNCRSYTLLISAQGNSTHPSRGEKIMEILEQVTQDNKEQKRIFKERRGEEYNEEMADTRGWSKIVSHDAPMYTVAMKAILSSPSSASLVLDLLEDAEKIGFVDKYLYSLAIQAVSRIIETVKKGRSRLSLAETAEKMLWRAWELKGLTLADKQFLMNACLDVWSRSYCAEMGQSAEGLMKKMLDKGVTPNAGSFDCIIRCWSKSFKILGAIAIQQAEAALQLQKELAMEGRCDHPTFQAYNVVILAHVGQKDGVPRAAALLEDMILAAREGYMKRPDKNDVSENYGQPCAPFAAFLRVLASARPSNDLSLWGADGGDDAGTDASFLSAVIADPMEMAIQIYESVTENVYRLKDLQPDHHFYAAFLRNLVAYGNPTGVGTEELATRVWDEACKNGQVSRIVLDQAYKIAAVRDTLPLQPSDPQGRAKIPSFWRRNVDKRWI